MGLSLSSTTPSGDERVPYSHPSLKQARRTHAKYVIGAFLAITVIAFTLLPLYWGAYYRQEENAYRLTVRIIDLDSQALPNGGAILGPAVVAAAMNNARAMPHYHLGWQYEDRLDRFSLAASAGAPTNVSTRGIDADMYARDLVNNQDVFGAIVIHSNATSAAQQAFSNPASLQYEPQGAISFYYEEARNFYSENQYVVFWTEKILTAATTVANSEFARRRFTAASSGGAFDFAGFCPTAAQGATLTPGQTSTVSTLPIVKPFHYSTFNLHPFDAFGAIAPTTAATVYLIVFTFFIGLFFKNTFEPLVPKLTFSSEILARLLVPGLGYFWISAMYSLVSLAFQAPFHRKYGNVGFFLYWMLNWTTQMGLGYTMELVLLAAGPLVFPFFLLFW